LTITVAQEHPAGFKTLQSQAQFLESLSPVHYDIDRLVNREGMQAV